MGADMGTFSLIVGIAIHNTELGRPEVNLSPELGVVRIEYQTNSLQTYCEHISGVKTQEVGYGLNYCGVNLTILKW